MRSVLFVLLSLAAAASVPTAGATASARSSKTTVTCADLSKERDALVQESKLTTSDVEAKNTALGEAADSLKAATDDARKDELKRRIEGLRRELSDLENKEHSQVDRLGALDTELSSRCKTGGKK